MKVSMRFANVQLGAQLCFVDNPGSLVPVDGWIPPVVRASSISHCWHLFACRTANALIQYLSVLVEMNHRHCT